MPGWTEDYEAMSEALIGSPFDTKEEVEARIKAREDAKAEWAARPWWGKAWHSSRDAKALVLMYSLMAFLLVDGLGGPNRYEPAVVSSRTYTAPYVRRESVLHGKLHRDEDVHYGPYWDVAVHASPRFHQSYRVTAEVYDACPEGARVNVAWRSGLFTGWCYNDWIAPAESGK